MTKAPKTSAGRKPAASAKPKKPAARAARPKAAAKAGKPRRGPVPKPLDAAALTPLDLSSPLGGVPRGLLPGALGAVGGRLCLALPETILSAEPGASGWEPVYQTPARALTPANAQLAERLGRVQDGHAAAAMGMTLPQDHALGPFVTFGGTGDDATLYCGTSSLWGGRILRSDDGRRFVPVCAEGMGDAQNVALSALAGGAGWLVAAPGPVRPAERRRGPLNADREVRIFGATKPMPGKWSDVAAPGFGAGVTGGVAALAEAQGLFYAAVEGPDRGFQLWRAAPRAALPWDWQKVLDRGAYRYSLNPTVTRMQSFNDALYLAAGISGTGFGKDMAGPAAAEILRVDSDGWDVIVGAPRFTPDGLKVPLSGLGPGFGAGFNTLIPAMVAHAGVLYAGTYNIEAQYRRDAEKTADGPAPGGAELWASADGETWAPVLEAGGGNPAMVSVGGLLSTGAGMCAALLTDPALFDSRDGEVAPGTGLRVRILRG